MPDGPCAGLAENQRNLSFNLHKKGQGLYQRQVK